MSPLTGATVMTKQSVRIAFPTLPGEWLRSFRLRVRDENGHSCSLEELGNRLGVSWRTIHRWETGFSQPSGSDLRALADFFSLTPFQTNFIMRAFINRRAGMKANVPLFLERATRLLRTEFPAYLVDDLFYIRGWNSYAGALQIEFGPMASDTHLLASIFDTRGEYHGSTEARLRYWIQTTWAETAGFCGSPGYIRMLQELSDIPGFQERWASIPLEQDSEPSLLGAPEEVVTEDVGTYRVFMSRIYFPPFFYLREYVPTDDLANQALAGLRLKGPPTVKVDPVLHWSLR
ncbi:MAG: helix-turn-helix domain-containing protein [Dehalococcoidia bacterium]|nr:helix-turn-helix domain-containing protein [Dehalococcoidia bacterium]